MGLRFRVQGLGWRKGYVRGYKDCGAVNMLIEFWGFLKIRGTISGVPEIRIIALGAPCKLPSAS